MAYICIVGFIISVVVLIHYYLTKNYGYWKKTGVPYLKGTLPGLGNIYPMFFMTKNISQLYREFYEKMPGCSMVGFYSARDPALLIRDPQLVKSVLQTNFSSFNSNGVNIDPKVDRLLGGNPFFLEGSQWKYARQQLSSAFTSGKLKYMYESIDVVCTKLVSYLDDKIKNSDGEIEIELKELFSRYTAEVVASAAFGVEGNSFKNDEDGTFTEIGKVVFEPSLVKGFKQFTVLFLPFMAKIFNVSFVPSKINKLFTNLVKDILKYRADNNVQRNDFMQLMLDLKSSRASDPGNHGDFSNETITSHAASFFFDGYETSSITLNFIGYQLASYPKIQQKLRDEVFSVIKKHNGINYEALQEMTYMDQVMQESSRIYPVAGSLFKVCTKDINLEGPDGITCRVTSGTPVMIPLAGLHKDPQYWPDPEKFDPDRFSVENKQGIIPFTYLPFGEGPRLCVGRRMALLQMKAAIATTIKNYSFKLSGRTQVPLKLDPRYFISSPLGGVWVKLKHL